MAKSKAVELLIKLKNETGQSFDEIQKDIDKLKKKEEGLEKQTKKNTKANKNNKKSNDTLKKSMGGVAVAITAVVAAYTAAAKASLEYNKEVINFSKLANTTSEDFEALARSAEGFGVSADDVASGLNDINNKIQEAANYQSGAFFDAAQVLGIDVKALAQMEDSIGAVDVFSNALDNATDAQRKFFADEVGSDAAIKLLSLTKETTLSLREQTEQQKELGRVVKESSRKELQELSKTFQGLSAVLETSFSESLSEISPYFRDLVDSINNADNIEGLGESFSVFNKILLSVIETLRLVANGFHTSFSIIKTTIETFLTGIKNGIEQLVGFFVKAFSNIPAKIGAIFNELTIKINKSIIDIINSFNNLSSKLNDDFTIGEDLVKKLTESNIKLRKEITNTENHVKAYNDAVNNVQSKKFQENVDNVIDSVLELEEIIVTNGGDIAERWNNAINPTNALKESKRNDLINIAKERIKKIRELQNEVKPKGIEIFNTIEAAQNIKQLEAQIKTISQEAKLGLISPEEENKRIIQVKTDLIKALQEVADNNATIENIQKLNDAKISLLGTNDKFRIQEINNEIELVKQNAQLGLINSEEERAKIESFNNDLISVYEDIATKEPLNPINLKNLNDAKIAQKEYLEQLQLSKLETEESLINQQASLNLINPEEAREKLIEVQTLVVDFYQQMHDLNPNGINLLNLNEEKLKLKELSDQFEYTSEDASILGESIGGDLKGAFTDAITGAESFQDAMSNALDSIISKLIDAIIQQTIFNSISKAASSSGSPFLQGIGAAFGSAHSGGVAGQTTQTRNVNPSAFNFATRYHTGGIAGLRPNEVPTILERGEEVLTANDPRHVNNVNNNNSTQTIESKNQIVENNIMFGDEQISKMFSTDSAKQEIANFINENPDKLNLR